MPIAAPVSTGQGSSHTSQTAKPQVAALAWQTAWESANPKPDQTSTPTDPDRSTNASRDHDKPSAHVDVGSVLHVTDEQSQTSPAPQIAGPKGHGPHRPTKTSDKTSGVPGQTASNPQALPVIAPVTPTDPAITSKPVGDANSQASAAEVPSASTGTAPTTATGGTPQHPDSPARTHKDADLHVPTGQQAPTIAATNQAAPSGTSQATASKVAKTTTSETGKAAVHASARPAIASTSQLLAASKLSIIPTADTSMVPGQEQTTGDLKKLTGDAKTIQPLESGSGSGSVTAVTTVEKTAPVSPPGTLDNVNIAPAALSATITALHHSGQGAVLLRLDPPSLGHLSIQLKMDAQGAVNVLFIPSTADAAQALHGSLPQLGAALAQSGLALGHADVGGQFSQSSGHNGQQGSYTPLRQTSGITAASAATPPISGLSAYA